MPVQSRGAYHKQNISWPLVWTGSSFARAMLATRYEAAIRHLLMTPRGSLWYAPDYGSMVSELRTQGMNRDKISMTLAALRQACTRYIPDVQIVDLTVEIQDDEQKLRIVAIWLIRDATPGLHGELADRKATTVLI